MQMLFKNAKQWLLACKKKTKKNKNKKKNRTKQKQKKKKKKKTTYFIKKCHYDFFLSSLIKCDFLYGFKSGVYQN